jgi:hypothetical protein
MNAAFMSPGGWNDMNAAFMSLKSPPGRDRRSRECARGTAAPPAPPPDEHAVHDENKPSSMDQIKA